MAFVEIINQLDNTDEGGKLSMSYTISLFTVGTKQKEQQLGQPDFFEKEENLKKFTEEQGLEKKNWQIKSGGLTTQLFHGSEIHACQANSESKLFVIFLR